MATLADWSGRYSRLSDGILQLEKLVDGYVTNLRGTQELVDAVSNLEQKKGTLEAKKKDLEQSAATSDREFLERKSGFPDPFYPDKLYTLQDFLLFFFFVSLCILIVATALTFPNSSGKVLGGGFVSLLVAFALIIRYA